MCLLKLNYPNWSGLYTHNQEDNLSVEEEPLPQDSTFSMESIFSKELKKAEEEERKTESGYIDCSFIGSSAGIVERFWSKFDALVDQRRSGMSPVMIEAILYLKENWDLWDIHNVRTALRMLQDNEKSARFQANVAALNLKQNLTVSHMGNHE